MKQSRIKKRSSNYYEK